MPELLDYKCPACSAPIKFSAAVGKMTCEYCGSALNIEDIVQKEKISKKEAPKEEPAIIPEKDSFNWEESEIKEEVLEGDFNGMTCSSCGAEIVGDKTTIAKECPYCGNTNISVKGISGMYKPDYIIPFAFGKDMAKKYLRSHYENKWPLPKSFVSENRIESIQAVYVPFWLYDGNAAADLDYDAQTVRHWSDNTHDHTETKYYSVNRAGAFNFVKLPVDGSSKMDDALMESIEPYDYKGLKEFAAPYLSGYLTDKYDIDQKESLKRANERVRNTAFTAFQDGMDKYDSISLTRSSINITSGKATSYVLLPVWLLTTKYMGKRYTFAINGQTGKRVGDLPIDNLVLNSYRLGFTTICIFFLYYFFKLLVLGD